MRFGDSGGVGLRIFAMCDNFGGKGIGSHVKQCEMQRINLVFNYEEEHQKEIEENEFAFAAHNISEEQLGVLTYAPKRSIIT